MQNIKLTLSYDGSSYHGFQIQENALAVQEVLEKAIAVVFKEQARVIAAGRTDTGVHALAQTVNFSVQPKVPVERIPHALNAVLPEDIIVTHACLVPAAFNARRDADSKIYTYSIDNDTFPRVLARKYNWHISHPLDVAAMADAAATLTGSHDFSSFCNSGSSVQTTVRNLMALKVEQENRFITITAEADGFLYNMVRIIAGTLAEAGLGKRDPNLTPVLLSCRRDLAGITAPQQGLVLHRVHYPPECLGKKRVRK